MPFNCLRPPIRRTPLTHQQQDTNSETDSWYWECCQPGLWRRNGKGRGAGKGETKWERVNNKEEGTVGQQEAASYTSLFIFCYFVVYGLKLGVGCSWMILLGGSVPLIL